MTFTLADVVRQIRENHNYYISDEGVVDYLLDLVEEEDIGVLFYF